MKTLPQACFNHYCSKKKKIKKKKHNYSAQPGEVVDFSGVAMFLVSVQCGENKWSRFLNWHSVKVYKNVCSCTELSVCKHGLLSSPAPAPLFTSPAKRCLPCWLCDVLREEPTWKSKVPVPSGLLWFKLWCDIIKGGSSALTDTSEGRDTSWNEGSQLLHTSSFPSTDLHLHEKAVGAFGGWQNKWFWQRKTFDISRPPFLNYSTTDIPVVNQRAGPVLGARR